MANFINTIDVLGDDAVVDSIIDRTITEFKDNSVTIIGQGAFANCKSLVSVDFPNVTEIGYYAFEGCTALAHIASQNATSLGNSAFRGCAALKAITPDTFPNVTTMKYMYTGGVFENSGLETVEWPSLIESGSYQLFRGCTSLRSADLPNVTTLGTFGEEMFCGCTALESVNLPKVTKLLNMMFSQCKSLKNLTLPCVTAIAGMRVISDCTVLESVDLPVCTSCSGSYNFEKCPALTALILRSETVCTLGTTNWFTNSGISAGTGYIYVPRALVDSYKAASNWSTFAAQFRALEDYTVDGTITGALDETKI